MLLWNSTIYGAYLLRKGCAMSVLKNCFRSCEIVFFSLVVLIFLPFFTITNALADPIHLIHEFAGGGNDGAKAQLTSLIYESDTLYGMTAYGGDADKGIVFKINPDSTSFTLLHEFAGGSDGARPYGSVICQSGVLYGMATYEGANNKGTVFKIGTDGTGYSILRQFAGGPDDGREPVNSVIYASGKLYGMTSGGGDFDSYGTIFKMNPDGTGFSLIHDFYGGANDGRYPFDSVIYVSGTLYGVTVWGGDSDLGTVFKIGTDGTGFTLLHEFAGGANDGRNPYSRILYDSGQLYGLTNGGGDSNKGTIFKIGTDGTGFTLLHEFAGGVNDGGVPYSGLICADDRLYGMTSAGGDTNNGTVFRIDKDGTDYTILYEFAGGANDGRLPYGSLVYALGKLYGITNSGGDSDQGTLFWLYANFADVVAALSDLEIAGYTDTELELLCQLYIEGKFSLGPADPVIIDGITWQYYDTLPGDTGYDMGTGYIYEGKKYIKLGSGLGELSGSGVPELPAGASTLLSLMTGMWLLRGRKPGKKV